MTVGVTIPLNTPGWSSTKSELAASKKEVQALNKEIAKAKKDGKKVTDEVVEKLAAAESRRDSLKTKLKTDGAGMRFREHLRGMDATDGLGIQSPFRHAVSIGPVGINIREKVMGLANKFTQMQGVQSVLGKILPASAMATLANGGVGALAESVSTAALPYAAAAAIPMALPSAISWGQGIFNHYSDDHRKAEADFSAQMADSNYTNGARRAIEIKRHKLESRKNDALGQAADSHIANVLTLGAVSLRNWRSNRRAGIDAYSTLDEDINQIARDSGASLSKEGAAYRAHLRDYGDTYGSQSVGFIMANTYGKLKNAFGSNADAEAIKKGVAEIYQRFQKFADEGDARAINGDLSGAAESYKQAAKEGGKKENWRDPMHIWTANQESTRAAKMIAFNQNPLAPLRRGQ